MKIRMVIDLQCLDTEIIFVELEVIPLEFEGNFIEAELLSVVELGSNISWPREEIC